MFNTTNIHKHNHTTYVEEKRAPTDASVQLLREMEKTAREQVIKSIQLSNNDLSGVVHLMEDYLSARTNVVILFKLNNKDHRVEVSLDNFIEENLDKRIEKIIDEVSTYLAGAILENVFKKEDIAQLARK
jgi:hypothetical protein